MRATPPHPQRVFMQQRPAARAWGPYRRWTSWIPVATSGSTLWMGIMGLAFIAFLATLRKRARRRRQWDEWDPDT